MINFINIGIDEYSKKSVADLDITSPEYQLLEAYLKGVNQFIDEGATPLEYHLIGLKKEHFYSGRHLQRIRIHGF